MEFQRDTLEVDVLIVGAGPAGLATAVHLADLIAAAKNSGTLKGAAASTDFTMMVIEKSAEVGDHILSGAVLDPSTLSELVPDWQERGAPVTVPVTEEAMYYLTARGRLKVPWVPPAMNHHGGYVISLSQLVKWLGTVAAEKGVDIYTKMAGAAPIIEDGKFCGVVTDDKGLDKNGNPKPNFEPGAQIRAKITVLAEGPRGSLTKAIVPALGLDAGCNPQSYLTGVKEIWEISPDRIKAGTVYHTLGFPLAPSHFGGGWIYAMSDRLLSVGFASALAYKNPRFDPHGAFQEFKTHPWVASLLEGGKMVKYGAKTISEGGYFAIPRLYHDGLMLVGESAGLLNSMRLKGIHLALASGMMAAKTAFQALALEDYSAAMLSGYERQFRSSAARRELWRARNFHQGFSAGLVPGMMNTAVGLLTGGRGFKARLGAIPDHLHMAKLTDLGNPPPPSRKFDGVLTFDKLTDVYASGTRHEENQPAHLKVGDPTICQTRCVVEYGNPCQYFCPAQVYEIVEDEGGKRLHINAGNCVHCKTCDIADPYGIITWTVPEGGGGPAYSGM